MKVSQWAEIRRLVEVEKLSRRAVATRLRCCFRTVARALRMDHPPDEKRSAPRVHFDGNRYSVPPKLQNTTVIIRASDTQVRVIAAGEVAACHARSYDRNQLISLPDHRLEALKLRSRVRARDIEEAFDALGEEARKFHLELRRQPVKATVHLRRLLNLVHL